MLAGVMAHEMAHVQLQHISRKLAREIGVSTLIMLTWGGEHLGALKEVLHTLSSRGGIEIWKERQIYIQLCT